MAAEAYEVLFHANKIRQEAKESVNEMQASLEQQFQEIINASLIGSLILMALAVLLGLINLRSVVVPIETLTQSFTRLSQGKIDTTIPDYPIDDEIGLLTRSAKDFQQKTIQIQQLLTTSEQLSRELLSAQERLMIATTSAQIGVWDWNLKTNELVWDDMMFKIYHLDRHHFSSTYEAWSTALHPDDRKTAEQTLANAIKNDQTFDTIFRIIWPNGQERYIKAFAMTLHDDNGEATHTIGVNYDITEFETLKHHLEQRVDEELAKQREQEQVLIQQSKLAAMGEMISAISHQWRQPLNAVSLYLQDLLSAQHHNQLDATLLEENVFKSRKQIEYMSQTIDDFRNFFNPNTEDSELNLKEIIAKTISMFEAQLKSHDIQMNFHPSDDADYQLMGNANHLQQSVANILSNAIDAIKERQKTEDDEFDAQLTIELMSYPEEYVIEVMDNGIGLSPQAHEKAFEPYFTTKDQGEGSGIGLYMTRTIIKKYFNGRIELQPQQPMGAKATVRLPKNPNRHMV